MARSDARATRRTWWTPCRRATTSTSTSAITTTSRSSTPSSRKRNDDMSQTAPAPAATSGPKPKKSVALSGVTAGNTALCTVGRTGNDLHYRGYDILDIADAAQFEEIAYLLVH